MSISKTTSKFAGVLGAAALVFSLAACSGGQSVADACSVAGKTVADAQEDMQSAMTDSVSGGGNFSDLISGVNEALVQANKQVTNSEVSDSLKALTTDIDKTSDLFEGLKIPSMENLDSASPEALAEIQAFTDALKAKRGDLEELQTSLKESSTKFRELCNI